MTTWRMRIACWIPKTTNTHSHYVILIAFTPSQWFYESTTVTLRELYSVCLVNLTIIPHITFSSCIADI